MLGTLAWPVISLCIAVLEFVNEIMLNQVHLSEKTSSLISKKEHHVATPASLVNSVAALEAAWTCFSDRFASHESSLPHRPIFYSLVNSIGLLIHCAVLDSPC